MVGAHLLVSWPAGGVLEHFIQEFQQKLWRDLFAGFPSRVLESTVFLARVNLFLQRDDSVGQPMGGHVESGQAALFQEIDFIGQCHDRGEFERGRFFTPSPLEFRESMFMILTAEPCLMPSSKRSLHRKIKEASARVGLKTHTPDDLMVSGTRLIFQEKVILEQGENRRDSKKSFTKMDEDGDLKNQIGIKMD
jgi:hypothetical protein